MRPDLVGGQIGRVEVGLCRVENHAVDTGLGVIFVVLHIAVQSPIGLDGKHVTVASVVVERVAVDIVGRLTGGEDEYRTSVGLAAGGESCMRSAGDLQRTQKTYGGQRRGATLGERSQSGC